MTRIVVVFPAPFGPRKPRTSPLRTSKLTSDTASVGPYRFVKPSTSIMSFYPYAGLLLARGQPARDSFAAGQGTPRSEEHTSELQSRFDLVCRLLLEKKK